MLMGVPYSICKRQFVRYFLASLSVLLFMHVSLCTCNYFVHLQTTANIIKYAPSIVGPAMLGVSPQLRNHKSVPSKIIELTLAPRSKICSPLLGQQCESHCIKQLPSNTLLQLNSIAPMMLIRVGLLASDCRLQYCPTYVQRYLTLAHSPAYLNFNCRFTVLCQQLSSERYLPTATLEEGGKDMV